MNVKPLLDFIGQLESRGSYDAIVWLVDRRRYPPKPVSRMTIGEVLDWQDSIDRFQNSEAVGKYQILEDTLRGMYRPAGLDRTTPFDESHQDYLATFLLRRRGLTDYVSGRISAEKFANALAHEWASLPLVTGPNKGRSVYAGDGMNRSLTKADEFLRIVKEVKNAPTRPYKPVKKSIWTRIVEYVRHIIRRLFNAS